MSSDWQNVLVGERIAVTKGAGYKGFDLENPEAADRLLSITSISPGGGFVANGLRPFGGKYRDDQACEPGDIVIALTDLTQTGEMLGSPAMTVDVGRKMICSHHTARIHDLAEDVHRKWLYYRLQGRDWIRRADAFAGGTTVRQFMPEALTSWEISWPPLDEQRRIAWVLGSLDDKIELNRRLARTLEEIAAAIFKARFIDFEGVAEFEDSEIGLIPKGWQVSTAGEELDPVGGGTPDTKHSAYWDDDGYEWATPKDLSGFDGQFLVDTSRRLSELGASKISSGLLPEGSVLLSSRAPVGYTAIAGVPMAINQGFIAVRPNESFGSAYVLLWLRSQLATIRRRAGGTTFAEISKKAFRPIPFLVPDTHSLSLFDEFVTPVFAGIRRAEAEMRTLVGVRDALLPKLISGRVRVPEGAGPDVDPLAEAA